MTREQQFEELKLARQAAIDEMVEEALEFGLPLEVATRMAPIILRFLVDPRGAEQALIEEDPAIAAILGYIVKH